MAISSTQAYVEYTGDSSTTSFTIPFYFLLNTDISVMVADADGNVTELTNNTDFTVTGQGVSSGGTCVLNTTYSNSYSILIYREPPETQETKYYENGKFPAKSHESALDKLTMLIQRYGWYWDSLALKRPNIFADYYDANGHRIANLQDPKSAQDAATKDYVDTQVSAEAAARAKAIAQEAAIRAQADALLKQRDDQQQVQINHNTDSYNALIALIGQIMAGDYTLLGDYSGGPYTFTALNQIITKDGYFYALKSSVSLPYTTTGNTATTWETDKDNFVAVGDAALRQEITSTGPGKGADIIPLTQGGTVQAALNYVTPEMFGAAGDKVTDDTVACQKAATYSTNNKIPLILQNMHLISSSITANNVAGIGDNCGFYMPSSFSGTYGVTTDTTQNLTGFFNKVRFENESTAISLFINKIWTANIFFNLLVSDCYFSATSLTSVGMKVYGAQGKVTGCTFQGNGTISRNTSKAIWCDGNSSGGAMNIQFVANSIMGWGYGFYALSTQFGLTEGLGLKLCNITGCTQCMYVKNIADFRVADCMLDNNDKGLYLENAYPLNVSGNYIMARYSNQASYTDYEASLVFVTNTTSSSGFISINISNNYLLPSATGVAIAAEIVIAGTSGYPILAPKITGNNFELLYRSIVLRYTQSAVIDGCYMKDTYTGTNIHLPSTSSAALVSNCTFNAKYGIVNQTGGQVMISNCNFVNITNVYPILSTVTTHNCITNQCLYNGARSEYNHAVNVTTTTAITSYTIAHGLAYEPTLKISAMANIAAAVISYVKCDATNITVYFASSIPAATVFNLYLSAALDLTVISSSS